MKKFFKRAVLMLGVASAFSSIALARVGNPVVLISGTFSTANDVALLADALRAKGREVYPIGLVNLGLAHTDESVALVSQTVNQVKAATGVSKVDLVGWSQGAHVARRYVQKGGVPNVDTIVMVGSPTYEWSWSTYLYRLTGGNCLGMNNCLDQQADSAVLHEMNDGPDMPEGVSVFNIWTLADEVVTPNQTVSILRDGNTGVQFPLQDVCPLRPTGHIGLVRDPVSWRIINTALDKQKAKPEVDCLLVPPFIL